MTGSILPCRDKMELVNDKYANFVCFPATRFCDAETQPTVEQLACNEFPCLDPEWSISEWQSCNATCGTNGVQVLTSILINEYMNKKQKAPGKL